MTTVERPVATDLEPAVWPVTARRGADGVLTVAGVDVRELAAPRLLLWQATHTVLENGLRLLGVSAPERM